MTPTPMQFLVVSLLALLAIVAGTLRVLWWFWTLHEEDAVRERMRQRANGGGVPLNSWAKYQQRMKEKQ